MGKKKLSKIQSKEDFDKLYSESSKQALPDQKRALKLLLIKYCCILTAKKQKLASLWLKA